MELRHLRKAKGLTQKALAKLISVDQTAISQWERGVNQPRLKHCIQLAKILDCKIEDLCEASDLSAWSTQTKYPQD